VENKIGSGKHGGKIIKLISTPGLPGSGKRNIRNGSGK
jgi:hypothetical protein